MKKILRNFKRHFNKNAKRVLVIGGVGIAVTAGAGAEARMHENATPPPSVTALVEQAQPQQIPKIKYAHSQERLDKVKDEMKKTDQGKALLQFAADENIRIQMSNSKVMDDNPNDNITIKGLNYSTLIRLNGDIASDDEIMITLAHEIRHSWHERKIESDDLDLTPKNEWLKRRIQEADCFAFEIHFAYEYEKATGRTLDLGERYPVAGQTTYGSMVASYEGWRADKNLTVGDAYSKLLAKTFSHVNRMGYDKRFVSHLSETWTDVAVSPVLQRVYRDRLTKPTSDTDFVAAMRKVATAGTKPGEDPAALTSWLDSDFLGFEKTGGKPTKANMDTFNTAELKYGEAKKAWQELNAPKPKPAVDTATTPVPPKPPAPEAPRAIV